MIKSRLGFTGWLSENSNFLSDRGKLEKIARGICLSEDKFFEFYGEMVGKGILGVSWLISSFGVQYAHHFKRRVTMKSTIIACAIGLAVLLNGAIGLAASEDTSTSKPSSTSEKAKSMTTGGGNQEEMGAGDPGVVVIQNKVTFGKAGKVTNNSRIDNSTGKAGAGSTVHLGTINIKDVIIDGKAGNEAKIRNSENTAIGEDSVATMGSVIITGGAIGKSGIVTNKTTIDSSRNMAMGKSNSAGMGAVIMNTAKVDGKVENRSQLETATNITSGENNTADVGTTTLHNSKLGKGGTIINTSDTRKSANIGMGINNKTHAGAVQVE